MIGNYFATYKCQNCGKVFNLPDNPTKVDDEDIPIIFTKLFQSHPLFGTKTYNAPLYLPHNCGNGTYGISLLTAFKKDDN